MTNHIGEVRTMKMFNKSEGDKIRLALPNRHQIGAGIRIIKNVLFINFALMLIRPIVTFVYICQDEGFKYSMTYLAKGEMVADMQAVGDSFRWLSEIF